MTALMMYRRWTEQPVRGASGVRPPAARADLIKAAAAVLRPLVVTAGVITAGAMSLAPAHADPPNDPIAAALNNAGIGNNGSFSTAIAGVGQSICPKLVKPGATFASVASQLAGNTGLSPGMAGLVASMAIQMECPGVMTSLANGNMPFPVQALGANPALPIPFQSAAANPFQLPGR
jgi:hypothetical protein